jgi:hypothetical protein
VRAVSQTRRAMDAGDLAERLFQSAVGALDLYTLRRYAERAGFADVEVLPIDDPQWRFYLLVPEPAPIGRRVPWTEEVRP